VSLAPAALAAGPVDYRALFEQGIPFQDFLSAARSRRTEWLARYREAKVDPEAVARLREIDGRRRLLVVAEDWCGDSSNTVPYLAKLAEAVPDLLELRVINASVGRPVMEAHKSADGRAATPTVAVLDGDGHLLGAWVERPSALQTWYLEQQDKMSRKELLDRKYKWYEDDHGKSTIHEVVDLLRKGGHRVALIRSARP
jgi:hypothetical protein